jgi:hypothetical protein
VPRPPIPAVKPPPIRRARPRWLAAARPHTATLAGALALAMALPAPAVAAGQAEAAPHPQVETPSATEVERDMPAGERLTGRELYDRFLKNRKRLRTAFQRGRILSTDPAGNPQETRFWTYGKDYRDSNDDPVEGVYSKALIKISGPYEVRHTGYLYVHRSGRPDDQFMYSPNRGRTARVHIKGQNVVGTDFSIDDFLVSLDDIEDADYRRLPDETVDGVPCYVVEAVMRPEAKSRYTRSVSYLEREHYVPLRTRYWDDAGVESKLLTSPHPSIREFDGAWVPTESTMVDLLEETRSTLFIEELVPNPPLDERAFTLSRLEQTP